MGKFMGLVAALSLLVLVGCSSTPGDAEVREALMAQALAIGGKEAAKMMKEDIDKVKVIGCVKAEAGGFKCDWTSPMGAASGRIVKADSGWVLVGG